MLSFRKKAASLLLRIAAVIRVRHFRGHGVHSPFAYRIVREAAMKSGMWRECRGRKLFDELIANKTSKRTASLIQRVYDICGYSSYSIDKCEGAMVLVSSAIMPYNVKLAECIVVINPRKSTERYKLCKTLMKYHRGLILDFRGVMFLFNNKGLNKERLKL